ncbi:arginine decarboxylase, pyruvoyl-dependent [Methanomicrobium antiquum]|uniref:Pyruvoyl-dependent arginine decarboxylase n=1 Tax=Methanomicrobium antiquum TaxID=487686 RepID=A0AAF0FWM8_9EURY|nr:arginine decarboxylase, pyruvoyl-dependent [Methanomicrobium antiquum]MDD3977588.1 arginine decarboxylase, pyruvoyl-dependent [Methanomicrobium sp.]WFN37658.1 arginine decarboxylase, pyruvoyl-dependent [Methanomicrobium antiquum]
MGSGNFVPKKVFFTSGSGSHQDRLTSFEMALRKASIECYNLVEVSSILPPRCRIISRQEGIKELFPGSIVFTVISRLSSNEAGSRITSSVGMAIPKNPETEWGYFAEYHTFDETKEQAGKYSEMIANNMYTSISDKIPEKTMNITESAVVPENGDWTTTIAAAVFLME